MAATGFRLWSVIFLSLCSYLPPNASVEGPQMSGQGQQALCFPAWSTEYHLCPWELGSWLTLDSWAHPHWESKVWEWVWEPVLLQSPGGLLGSLNILGVTLIPVPCGLECWTELKQRTWEGRQKEPTVCPPHARIFKSCFCLRSALAVFIWTLVVFN